MQCLLWHYLWSFGLRFISGFDGGELCLIGITTSYGYYYLLNPLPVYKEYIQGILYKGEVTKLVVEYVLDYGYLDPSYEDMCTFVDSQPKYLSNNKKIIIDDVINNGKFICKQVIVDWSLQILLLII